MNIEKQQTTAGAGQDRAEKWKCYKNRFGGWAKSTTAILNDYERLQAQRDELLEAAKWTCCCTGEYLYGDSANPVCDYARKDVEHALGNLKDAIAKCEGGAK